MNGSDLDLRLVRYFVTVAEHRHFGRAAQALLVGQPSLSRQVRRLEEQVGARLLDRTPQGTQLTGAGTAFLPRARALLRMAAQATGEARAAADPSRLTVGYITSLIVTPAVLEMRRRHPDSEIRATHVEWPDVPEALLGHRIDVAVARLPFPTAGLHVTVLYDERRAVLLPAGHRLASRESVSLDDIADEPIPRLADPESNAYWRIDPRPDGRRPPDGPLITGVEDKFEVVASGQAIAIVVAAPRPPRRDLVIVPLVDAPPSHVVIASREGDNSRLVSAFRKHAQSLLPPVG
ncbi:LysR family transcriptional regulator [Kineosporia sp. J2-2]|uniref:LysR family transcriptional regulator n=1 Tax=Kineosporia corallincola TaxID=2835133 RepID=A0ABS5TMA0_9ACTN|nr:LysR family transcriptional regulator [Kineosporia corallincola]MBT0772207.1 LysR family transcriptional regulator [Kineosporia corallincola]